MTIDVDFEDKEGYVFVSLKGNSDKGGMLEAFEKIIVYSTVSKAAKMLVDCRGIESKLPMADIASISERFDNIHTDYEGMMNINVTFAFLIDKEQHDPNLINKTLYEESEEHSYVGGDYEEAEKWLLNK